MSLITGTEAPVVRIALLSDLRLDGRGTEVAMLVRRALATPQAARADLVVVAGGVTANGAPAELDAARALLASTPGRAGPLVLPDERDLAGRDRAARAEAWLARFDGDCWPWRISLLGGRCVVFGLDSTRDADAGRGRLGAEQVAALDAELAQLDEHQRRVVVLRHDPLGGRVGQPPLRDHAALWPVLEEGRVDVVLYGGQSTLVERRRSNTRLVGMGPTVAGCGLTGQRSFAQLTLDADSGALNVDRVQFAPPLRRPELAEVFASADAARAFTQLAEKAAASEQGLRALARELSERAARLRTIDRTSEALDRELEALLRRAEQGTVSAAEAALLTLIEGGGDE